MSDVIDHLHAVVLAGGSGVRFWPLSRELAPKQLLTVFGGTSLVTRAIARIAPYTAEPVVVLTSERILPELRDHLAGRPELADTHVELAAEPCARNTAAALALAAAYAQHSDPDAILVMVPSDHLLEEGPAWIAALISAAEAARQGRIVTLGLVPDRPETGYGYIRPGSPLAGTSAFEVAKFAEKPSLARAEELIGQGCLWNSGMVVARAADILAELRAAGDAAATPDSAHGAQIAAAAEELGVLPLDEWSGDEARAAYCSLPSVQFDRAVLEVSSRVAVVPIRLAWSDVGSLLALQDLGEPDERGNVLVGRAVDVESSGVLAYSADRLVATLGLRDVLVVDTADATLVAAKDRAQDVRMIVEALKASGAPEVVASRTSLRPWGSWSLLLKCDGFQVKQIEVLPGKRLSLQSHERRSEHWVVVEGTALVERDGDSFELAPGCSADIPMGAVHRLENAGDGVLRVIEIALGDYLAEDDIQRFSDDWQRGAR